MNHNALPVLPAAGLAVSAKQFLTPKEVETLGFASRSKLKKDRIKGVGIPFIYVGRHVRYLAQDVYQWAKDNRSTRALQLPASDRRKSAMSADARAKRAQQSE